MARKDVQYRTKIKCYRELKELYAIKGHLPRLERDVDGKFLPISIDNELQQKERESAFGALLEAGLLNHYNLLCDPLFNEEIPRFWDAWNSTKDMVFVSKIVRHNYCCLAKEHYLKLVRIDKLDVNELEAFPSSAQIEKRHIRRQLNFL